MNGGTITGFKIAVYLWDTNTANLIFTMNGGTISGNNNLDGSGIVYIRGNGGSDDSDGSVIFTMNGGEISGNTSH